MRINYYENLFTEIICHMKTLEKDAYAACSLDGIQQCSVWSAMMSVRRILTGTAKVEALTTMLRQSEDKGRWLSTLTRILTVLRLMYQNQVPAGLTQMTDDTINTIENFLRTNAWQ